MKNIIACGLLISWCLGATGLSGCVEDARTGLVCPPGSHPGPHGHKCFAD